MDIRVCFALGVWRGLAMKVKLYASLLQHTSQVGHHQSTLHDRIVHTNV